MRLISLLFFSTFSVIKLIAQLGCTDSQANNYNASATINDGSCTYSASSISVIASQTLNIAIKETSGLIKFGNLIYTHNDDTDLNLYALDTITGAITQTHSLPAVVNTDWEEISQDSNYVYIGDFGNNVSGNRTDLHILKISKISLLTNSPVVDTIYFSYSNQTNYTATSTNNTDFDCEAFIVTTDSIYLFTKQWVSNGTSIYSLPKQKGSYVANLKATLNVQGLVTGATLLQNKKIIALCGYSSFIQPFIYLLYDYTGNNFVNGNKRKISISLPYYPTEGITTTNGIKYYLSNERYINGPLNNPQQLHILDLSSFLSTYINSFLPTQISEVELNNTISIYPNPCADKLTVSINNTLIGEPFKLFDASGKLVLKGLLKKQTEEINLSKLTKGVYTLLVGEKLTKKIVIA